MNPARLVLVGRRHLDHDLRKFLARHDARKRIVAFAEKMVVPVAELKTLSIAIGVAATALDALHRMETPRRVVRPENVARLAEQYDTLRRARPTLAERSADGREREEYVRG